MVDPTNPALMAQIYGDINQGWEIFIIPYAYCLLRPNRIAALLFIVAIVNIFHNLLSYIAFYIQDISPGTNVQNLWTAQAASAAFIRSLELYCNLLIVSTVSNPNQLLALKIISVVALFGVWGGRIYDVYGAFLIPSTIRIGLGIVAASGLLQSLVCLYVIHSAMNQTKQVPLLGFDQVHRLLFKSAVRLIFIQFIDIFEFIGAIWMRGSIYSLWWDMIAGNLDNSRGLFMLFDLLMTKIENLKATRSSNSSDKKRNEDVKIHYNQIEIKDA
ncbi:hypothetical protein HDV06_006262 [Boothiomyces sp. JEL0866]|nr:hypothetical protein HDV06_006262 [Boothiomyces sp. JEL0866]